jgi:3',5'-cyclic AMP phosphodiesterase CpdA
LEPFYSDDEIAVVGINTARSLTIKNGRINARQVANSCARLNACADKITRILVTHHPFDVAEARNTSGRVGRADMAMVGFANCRIDMILAGHLHASRTGDSSVLYKIPGYAALLIQAGTATSSRRRGELNAWNLIRIERPHVSIDCMIFDADRSAFAVSKTERFQFGQAGWSRVSEKPRAGEDGH